MKVVLMLPDPGCQVEVIRFTWSDHSREGSADQGTSHSPRVIGIAPHCLRKWRARKKVLRRHRRNSGLTVAIEVSWSRTGYAIFVIIRIGEPEDYVVQVRADPGDVVKCERLI